MPVIIEKADWPVWLGEAKGDAAAMLHPAPNDVLRVWRVDKKVGNVRNDGPDLIKPIAKLEADPDLVTQRSASEVPN